MAVKIFSDTSCDLPLELIEKYDIKLMPMSIIIDGREYFDRVTLATDEFYRLMAQSAQLPKTSSPPRGHIEEAMKSVLETGDEGLFITMSSKMSSTFSTCTLTAQALDESRLLVFDSRSATFAQGLLAIQAALMAKSGERAAEILKRLEELSARLELISVFHDLTNLKKGGRISPAQALLGTALNIKPILDIRDGGMNVVERVRGTKKVYAYMAERFNAIGRDNTLPLAFGSGCADAERAAFAGVLSEYTDISGAIYSDVGATIGTHTGAQCVGVAWFKK